MKATKINFVLVWFYFLKNVLNGPYFSQILSHGHALQLMLDFSGTIILMQLYQRPRL